MGKADNSPRWWLSDVKAYQQGTLWWDKGISLYPHLIHISLYSNCWHGKHKWAWNNSGSTPTTKINAPMLPSLPVELSQSWVITYFYSDKKSHYATKCPKSMKDRNTSWKLVTVLTTCASIKEIKEATLQQIFFIQYWVRVQKKSRKSYNRVNDKYGHNNYNGLINLNNHNSYDNHDNYIGPNSHSIWNSSL